MNANKFYDNLVAQRNYRMSVKGYQQTLMELGDFYQEELGKLLAAGEKETTKFKHKLYIYKTILREMERTGIVLDFNS